MSIGKRIKEARKDASLSQAELSQMVGIRQPTLSDLENDMSKGTTKLASIARVLKVNPYWLETGKGAKGLSSQAEIQNDTHAEHPKLSEQAISVARAFDALKSDAQRQAVLMQLKAFTES